MISVTLFNVALLALVAVMVYRGRRARGRGIGALLASEQREERSRHARERARRYRQICRGVLRRENGLGVEVTPRSGRPRNELGARCFRRRMVRLMQKRGVHGA